MRVVGILAAFLPRRTWQRFEPAIPVYSSALASGLLTFSAGLALGIPAFLSYVQGQSGMYVDLLMNAADRGRAPTTAMAAGMNAFALFTFLLFTPAGLATLYLASTGFVRAVGAWFDDPRGDLIISTVDLSARTLIGRTRNTKARTARRALEGPETRDIVVTGARALIPDADLVVVSARRKPGWEQNTVVVTESGTYRIGPVVERTIEGQLRTLYPLVEHKDFEAFRRVVHYTLPPNISLSL